MQQFLGGRPPNAGQWAGQGHGHGSEWANHWTSTHPEPFTPAWYAHHPQAWHHWHPHADVFVAATVTGLAAWMATPMGWTEAGGAVSYVEGDAPGTEESAELQGEQAAVDTTTPGTTELNDAAAWMPIGVYQLKPAGAAEASRILQLAVSREGMLRGTHYDMISDETHDVRGAVNKQTLQATWTIGKAGKVVFEAQLDELTKTIGKVSVRQPNGQTDAWTTVQVTK